MTASASPDPVGGADPAARPADLKDLRHDVEDTAHLAAERGRGLAAAARKQPTPMSSAQRRGRPLGRRHRQVDPRFRSDLRRPPQHPRLLRQRGGRARRPRRLDRAARPRRLLRRGGGLRPALAGDDRGRDLRRGLPARALHQGIGRARVGLRPRLPRLRSRDDRHGKPSPSATPALVLDPGAHRRCAARGERTRRQGDRALPHRDDEHVRSLFVGLGMMVFAAVFA